MKISFALLTVLGVSLLSLNCLADAAPKAGLPVKQMSETDVLLGMTQIPSELDDSDDGKNPIVSKCTDNSGVTYADNEPQNRMMYYQCIEEHKKNKPQTSAVK